VDGCQPLIGGAFLVGVIETNKAEELPEA